MTQPGVHEADSRGVIQVTEGESTVQVLRPLNVHLHKEVGKGLVKRHDYDLLVPLDQALDHLHRVHVNKHALHSTSHILVEVPEQWAQSFQRNIASHFFQLGLGCFHVKSDALVLNLQQAHVLLCGASDV